MEQCKGIINNEWSAVNYRPEILRLQEGCFMTSQLDQKKRETFHSRITTLEDNWGFVTWYQSYKPQNTGKIQNKNNFYVIRSALS